MRVPLPVFRGSHLDGSAPQSCTQSAWDAYMSRRMVSVLCPHAERADALISTSVTEDEDRRRFMGMPLLIWMT